MPSRELAGTTKSEMLSARANGAALELPRRSVTESAASIGYSAACANGKVEMTVVHAAPPPPMHASHVDSGAAPSHLFADDGLQPSPRAAQTVTHVVTFEAPRHEQWHAGCVSQFSQAKPDLTYSWGCSLRHTTTWSKGKTREFAEHVHQK